MKGSGDGDLKFAKSGTFLNMVEHPVETCSNRWAIGFSESNKLRRKVAVSVFPNRKINPVGCPKFADFRASCATQHEKILGLSRDLP